MIAKHLRRAEFTEPQIHEMKTSRKFVLICDGYDESQQTQNLYTSNQLNQEGEWDAQMIISCRTEYLGANYRYRFQPGGDRNQQSDSPLYQEAFITPFSLDMVHDYIRQYVFTQHPLWQYKDYMKALDLIPSLKDLVTNPFLMTLSVEVLPRIVDLRGDLSNTRVTSAELYDHFVGQWLERGKRRLGEKDMSRQAREEFDRLVAEGFTVNGIGYMKKFAVAIYKEQDGQPVVEYSQLVDEGSWKDQFFKCKDKQILHEACPMTRNGNQHRFIHRSLLEYALALAIFDPQDRRNKSPSEPVGGRRASVSSTFSFEIKDSFDPSTVADKEGPDANSPLVWRSFVSDHSLLQFLDERVEQEPTFKKQLHDYIEHSKVDKKWRIAAANAITILVRAGVKFAGKDLRGIRIPGADLSYGVFNEAQLHDADLRKVNLQGVLLRQADLRRAQMDRVQLGELPSSTKDVTLVENMGGAQTADALSERTAFTEDSKVLSCAYSPDGKSFAVGLDDGDISVYSTLSWTKTQVLGGHTGAVRVVYSPMSDQLASGSEDRTVRLWDSATGSALIILTGHIDYVNCVVYSPQGNTVASASDDQTVRVWNAMTGECLRTLFGHTGGVSCVAFSPDGSQIVSGGEDGQIRLYDVETGACQQTIIAHAGAIHAIQYSPQGNLLASASEDKSVHLWNAKSLQSHLPSFVVSDSALCVAFSPRGDQLASGHMNGTMALWEVASGSCLETVNSDCGAITSVVYSPQGTGIAFSGANNTVQLRGVSVEASHSVSSGQNMVVTSVKCSPKGNTVASGTTDGTIQIWNVDTGAHRRTLPGHENSVLSIAFSLRGDRIVSGGADMMVRLWDVESGQCQTFPCQATVNDVAYSPRGDTFASASSMTVSVWNSVSGDCDKTLDGHSDTVLSVVYSTKGDRIASCSKDGTVRVWETTTWTYRALEGHTKLVRNIMFSPSGHQLASASFDNTIRLWDMATTTERYTTLQGHKSGVNCIAYSVHGDLLVSGGWDKTLRLWDTGSGQCHAEIQSSHGVIHSIAWSATSDVYLITGCGDGSVLKWKVIKERTRYRLESLWTTNGTLSVTGASIQDVSGLSPTDQMLLGQLGAIGKPMGDRESQPAST